MKNSNAKDSAHPRKTESTISSTVVRCICITASCIVTACGLLGLAATCFIIKLTDPTAAPCPFLMSIIVTGVAGLLLSLSLILLIALCARRNRMRRKAQLEDLPVACVVEEEHKSKGEEECKQEEEKEKTDSVNPEEPHGSSDDNFEMTQKSADVSLWIEQQKSTEVAADCYQLENADGVTSQEKDEDSSESEMTSL